MYPEVWDNRCQKMLGSIVREVEASLSLSSMDLPTHSLMPAIAQISVGPSSLVKIDTTMAVILSLLNQVARKVMIIWHAHG